MAFWSLFHLQLSQTGPVKPSGLQDNSALMKPVFFPLWKLPVGSLCPHLWLIVQPRITELFTAPQITDVTQRCVWLQAPTGSSSEALLKPALAAQVDVTHPLPLLLLRGAAQLCSNINPLAFKEAPVCNAFQLHLN